jgi:hypothetical protein
MNDQKAQKSPPIETKVSTVVEKVPEYHFKYVDRVDHQKLKAIERRCKDAVKQIYAVGREKAAEVTEYLQMLTN